MKQTNENPTHNNEQLTNPSAEPLAPVAEAESATDHIEIFSRLQAENDTLRRDLRLRDARDHITEALATAGARSPQLLFEAAKDSLEFDDDGKLANGADVLQAMQKRFPEQFGSEPQTASIDGAAGTFNRGNLLTKEALARMKPHEIAKLDWADVRSVLANG